MQRICISLPPFLAVVDNLIWHYVCHFCIFPWTKKSFLSHPSPSSHVGSTEWQCKKWGIISCVSSIFILCLSQKMGVVGFSLQCNINFSWQKQLSPSSCLVLLHKAHGSIYQLSWEEACMSREQMALNKWQYSSQNGLSAYTKVTGSVNGFNS